MPCFYSYSRAYLKPLILTPLLKTKKQPKTEIEKLNKIAEKKFIQDGYISALVKYTCGVEAKGYYYRNTTKKNSYLNSFYCSSVFLKIDKESSNYTGHFCKNRFCTVCNNIRTGKLINGYHNVLEQFANPRFVTLTVANVNSMNLRNKIKQMIKYFTLIRELRRKQKLPIWNGIRKLEVTYNEFEDTYHPHFHIVIDGEKNADELIKNWLQRFSNETDYRAQNNREAFDLKELFKYFTKLFSIRPDENIGTYYIYALDNIFMAVQNLRTVQTFGNVKMQTEKIEKKDAQIIINAINKVVFIDGNYFDQKTGEQISNNKYSEATKIMRDNIVINKSDNKKNIYKTL